MGLRAPRVALVVPGWDDWKLMVRAGIHAATTMWGGAGFIVVPVAAGGLNPAVVAAVRAYDPDSIVVPQGNSLVERDAYPKLRAAQASLSKACSNYRSAIANDESVAEPDVGSLWASFFGTSGPGALTAADDVLPPADGAETVGANPSVGGALGVLAAQRWGLSDPPSTESTDVGIQLRKRAIFELLSGREDSPFGSPEGITTRARATGDFTTDFARTLFGLEGVVEVGGTKEPPALLMWGDDPADFGLALAWDRTYGTGIWVPDEWWRDPETKNQVITAIDDRASRVVGWQNRELAFTSTSLPREDLEARVEDCRIGTQRALGKPVIPGNGDVIVPSDEIAFSRYHKLHYVIRGKQINQWSTAVRDDDDGVEFAMLPPLPQIAVPGLEVIEQKAKWQVDVTVGGHEIPCTTAVPDRRLLAAGENVYSTRVRSGRSGISFESHNSFFIPANLDSRWG